MRLVLAQKVPEEGTQEDLAAREVVEVMEVAGVVKENLAVAVAKELTVAARADTAAVREAMVVAAKKDLVAVLAEGEDGEGSRAIVLIMVHNSRFNGNFP